MCCGHLPLTSLDSRSRYRRHRHAFMVKIFAEVDQDGSKTLSLSEMVALLGRRGITPVMSCVERIFREVTGEREVRDLSFEEPPGGIQVGTVGWRLPTAIRRALGLKETAFRNEVCADL